MESRSCGHSAVFFPFPAFYRGRCLMLLFSSLFFLILLPERTVAQRISEDAKQKAENSYLEFRNFFENEIRQHRQKRPEKPQLPAFHYTDTLPGWLFTKMKTSRDSIYLLGVSDPGMDEKSGLELAKNRAWLMFLLAGEIQVSNMRDHYSHESENKFSQAFLEYSEVYASRFIDTSNPEVVYSHVSKFGETLVLLRVPAPYNKIQTDSNTLFSLETELFTQFKYVGNRMQIDEKLNLAFTSPDVNLNDKYHYVKIHDIVNTRTFSSDTLVADLPALSLKYIPAYAEDNTITEPGAELLYGNSLGHGIWHALISGLLHSLVDACHEGCIHFRHMSDIYNQQHQFLNRELVSSSTQLGFPALMVRNNRLYFVFQQ